MPREAFLCLVPLLLVACSAGRYRYIDQSEAPRQAHRRVIEAAESAGLVPADRDPPAHGADEVEVYALSAYELEDGEEVDLEKAQLVTIRTFATRDGSRTELASVGWWLSPTCRLCGAATSFPIEDSTSTKYSVNRMPAIAVTRISLIQNIEGVQAIGDSSLRLGKTLWSSGGQRARPTGHHQLRASGALGVGWDFVGDSDGDGSRFVGARARPGFVLEHIYDRHARPMLHRGLPTSWWALHTELAIEPYFGSRSGIDATLGFRVEPFGGIFARIGRDSLGATYGAGIEFGAYAGYLTALVVAIIPFLVAAEAVSDVDVPGCWRCNPPGYDPDE